jgi:hypothetical protein
MLRGKMSFPSLTVWAGHSDLGVTSGDRRSLGVLSVSSILRVVNG